MKSKIFAAISILVLLIILIIEFYFIKNNSFTGYFLDFDKNYNKNNYIYLKLEYEIDLLSEKMHDKSRYVLYYDNKSELFSKSLITEEKYIKTLLYPNLQYRYIYCEDCLINEFDLNKVDYIISIGKNSIIFNNKNLGDFNLYKVNNNSVDYIYYFNSSMTDIYIEYEKNNQISKFNKFYKKYLNALKYYSTSPEELEMLGDRMLYDKKYDKAEKFYEDYLNNYYSSSVNYKLYNVLKLENKMGKKNYYLNKCNLDKICKEMLVGEKND